MQVLFHYFRLCNKNFFQKFKLLLSVPIFDFHNILQVCHYYSNLLVFFRFQFQFDKLHSLISLVLYMVLFSYLRIWQNGNVQYPSVVPKLYLLFQILQNELVCLRILFVFIVTSLYYLLHYGDMNVISLLIHMLVAKYCHLSQFLPLL